MSLHSGDAGCGGGISDTAEFRQICGCTVGKLARDLEVTLLAEGKVDDGRIDIQTDRRVLRFNYYADWFRSYQMTGDVEPTALIAYALGAIRLRI